MGHGDLTLRYRVVATIRLDGLPDAVAEDPLTDLTGDGATQASAASAAARRPSGAALRGLAGEGGCS